MEQVTTEMNIKISFIKPRNAILLLYNPVHYAGAKELHGDCYNSRDIWRQRKESSAH
jgi:hypothetical protein